VVTRWSASSSAAEAAHPTRSPSSSDTPHLAEDAAPGEPLHERSYDLRGFGVHGVEVAQLVNTSRATTIRASIERGSSEEDRARLHFRHASLDVRASRSVHAEIERVLADAWARPVLRFYDVKDAVRINLVPSHYSPPSVLPATDVDQLIECIRATVEPRSWDTVEGADIQSKNLVLVVTATPRVHRGIKRYLGVPESSRNFDVEINTFRGIGEAGFKVFATVLLLGSEAFEAGDHDRTVHFMQKAHRLAPTWDAGMDFVRFVAASRQLCEFLRNDSKWRVLLVRLERGTLTDPDIRGMEGAIETKDADAGRW
jgi:hypothetical protein